MADQTFQTTPAKASMLCTTLMSKAFRRVCWIQPVTMWTCPYNTSEDEMLVTLTMKITLSVYQATIYTLIALEIGQKQRLWMKSHCDNTATILRACLKVDSRVDQLKIITGSDTFERTKYVAAATYSQHQNSIQRCTLQTALSNQSTCHSKHPWRIAELVGVMKRSIHCFSPDTPLMTALSLAYCAQRCSSRDIQICCELGSPCRT